MAWINGEILDARLRSIDAPGLEPIVTDVSKFFSDAKDEELVNINPRRYARDRGLDPLATIKAFLHLTKAGVLDMSWSVHCPHCKGVANLAHEMSTLKEHLDCPVCKVDFHASFDKNVELTFRLSESIADVGHVDPFDAVVGAVEFEPGINIGLDPGEEHRLVLSVTEGNYWIVPSGGRSVINLPIGTHPPGELETHNALCVEFESDSPPVRIYPFDEGELDITVVNKTNSADEYLVAKTRAAEWTDAGLVSTLQEFRDFFSKEMISPDQSFAIQNIALVFTDIKSSTEMYESLGDSKAFYLVKEHFEILRRAVTENHGAIVKTIGDAVMAAFTSPTRALAAAKAMIEAFEEEQVRERMENQIVVKVGAHVGSCIAVTLNERIDYFGTTVNAAARIQGLSDGRDIMVSRRLFEDGRAEGLFADSRWRWEEFRTSLKGLNETYAVYKFHID